MVEQDMVSQLEEVIAHVTLAFNAEGNSNGQRKRKREKEEPTPLQMEAINAAYRWFLETLTTEGYNTLAWYHGGLETVHMCELAHEAIGEIQSPTFQLYRVDPVGYFHQKIAFWAQQMLSGVIQDGHIKAGIDDIVIFSLRGALTIVKERQKSARS